MEWERSTGGSTDGSTGPRVNREVHFHAIIASDSRLTNLDLYPNLYPGEYTFHPIIQKGARVLDN